MIAPSRRCVRRSGNGHGKSAVLLLNFGEPEDPTLEEVVSFLEGIFRANGGVEGPCGGPDPHARGRQLARARAPALLEEYRVIGGSPLNRQARVQADLLMHELGERGYDVDAFLGMQFTAPSISAAVAAARKVGAKRLIALPVYPLAGPSTTDAALRCLRGAVWQQGWFVPVREIPVWHRRSAYVQLRADAVRTLVAERGLDLHDPATALVFSAHGTPLKYLSEGSRYVDHVQDFCSRVGETLGIPAYRIGYQNHGNRPGVAWTQPEVEQVVRELADEGVERVVVDPVSFMHEQSETLVELDHELRGVAEEVGVAFHRVPIPHDSSSFIQVLADLAEDALNRGRF